MQAMILAAGRGERMRPLSNAMPKPLLEVGGKPLIVWQLERLVAAGCTEVVINLAHHGEMIAATLGNGSRFGAKLRYSREPEPLEVAGGIATALPLLGDDLVLVVSGDVYTDYDYALLGARAAAMRANAAAPHLHLVMVPNPPYHPGGDFTLADGMLSLDGPSPLTFGNVALYRTALFQDLPRGEKRALLPLYREWIGRGWASGEAYAGTWANVGTPDELARLDRLLRGTLGESRQ
ncbi:MAG TPA: nucleotidyltransferase family protein [Casimicrobiaceae bacterium]|jgi:MurNAc alpha-1-phosphate uridylyltransferase|nr:nucleotidyltransferase family protein [Casimicrobiaceae bacterium]